MKTSFHPSEPIFFVLTHGYYILIYHIENETPICNKILHLQNYNVIRVCWVNKTQ